MLKKIFFILFNVSLCVAEPAALEKTQNEGMSTGKIFMWCGIGAGGITLAVVCAPMVLSAGTIVTIKATAVAIAAKATAAGAAAKSAVLVAAPIATKFNLAVGAAQLGKKLMYPSAKEKLEALQKAERSERCRAKLALEDCLIKNDAGVKKNSLGVPTPCEEVAMIFALCLDGRGQ